MSLSVLPEDFGLLTNLTSLELRENLIKVKTSFSNRDLKVSDLRSLRSVAVVFKRCYAIFKGL
jgi:hypothetical protein